MPEQRQGYDVLVIGGGNAGLCAALTARQAGASVHRPGGAPRHFRGGNSRHTRNFRCAHAAPTDVPDRVLPGGRVPRRPDSRDRARGRRGAGAAAHLALRRMSRLDAAVRRALPVVAARHAAPRAHERVLPGRRQGADEQLLRRRRARSASAWSTTRRSSGSSSRDGQFHGRDRPHRRPNRSDRAAGRVVVAAGGFEANLEWLREVWGERGRQLHHPRHAVQHRHAPEADARRGRASRSAIRAQCHAIAVDARAPRFDGGIVTRLDSLPFGIVVNRHGERFYDEGEDVWPKRYAIWGRLIARAAGSDRVFDRRCQGGRHVHAVGVSADGGGFDPRAGGDARVCPPTRLEATVAAFNRAVRPGTFNHAVLDDCRTEGLAPAKSHWAQRLDTPPFWGYPLRPGITFTYLGLQGGRDRARRDDRRDTRRATSTRPARSWPATSCGRDTSPGSA